MLVIIKEDLISMVEELSEKMLNEFSDDEIVEAIIECKKLKNKLMDLIDLLAKEDETYDDIMEIIMEILDAVKRLELNLTYDR